MSSSLGLYIENNLIKYAKVSKNNDLIKVESFGIKFYEKLEDSIKQIVEEILDIARKDLVYTKIKAPTNKERDKKKYYHKKCKSNIQNSF